MSVSRSAGDAGEPRDTFELWDTDSGNCIGFYKSVADAFRDIRRAPAPAEWADVALLRCSPAEEIALYAAGADLYAQAMGAKEGNVSRTDVFELWDAEVDELLGRFGSQEEALAFIRRSASDGDYSLFEEVGLVSVDGAGCETPVVYGQELITLARGA